MCTLSCLKQYTDFFKNGKTQTVTITFPDVPHQTIPPSFAFVIKSWQSTFLSLKHIKDLKCPINHNNRDMLKKIYWKHEI